MENESRRDHGRVCVTAARFFRRPFQRGRSCYPEYMPPASDPCSDFEANPTVDELLEQQGTGPISDLSAFGGGWPDDESVEDFLAALREWRGHAEGNQNDRAA